ncbi:enoyl-CoA hydratase/isomerase family protein [Pseudooceanicola sp.]|uniref:enoyl-CoA hydratase/isomerase family protein n=1 Tax=Pseudooceanicola sp. TaxID=1914328 RepID=UPI0040592A81
MTQEYETIVVEKRDDGLMIVTFNRPEVYNAMNTAMMRELGDVFAPMVQRPGDVRCVILTGAGEKAFCSGGDLKQRNSMNDDQWFDQHLDAQRAIFSMADCPVPIICAVNGVAFAGGLEMTLSCDFTYCAPHARFAITEVSRGIMPGGGGVSVLPNVIGERRAKEMVLAARPIDAEKALEWGLVNKICAEGKLMEEVMEVAEAICANAPLSVKQAKKAMTIARDVDRKTSHRFALEAYHRLILSEDRVEGMLAFNEKRTPVFKGR